MLRKLKIYIAILGGVIALLIVGIALYRHYELPGGASRASNGIYPDPILTPGAFRDADKAEVCNTRTKTVRDVPESEKMRVFHEYGMRTKHDLWCSGPNGCEVDHLASLELSGSNDIRNLWPQPYDGPWNAHMKDQLENKLHRMVCDNEISLQEAQQLITRDWVSAYKRYVQ